MKYSAILFMCNDVARASWVSNNFKLHNPDIPLTIYNGGVDDRDVRSALTCDHYVVGDNLWHTNTRLPPGSFSFSWFETFFDLAEAQDADYTIFLETDVKVNAPIKNDPAYDISGVVTGCGSLCYFLAYDYWGNYQNGLPFEEYKHTTWSHKFHSGAGGTCYTRNFFNRSRSNLYLVKKAFSLIPFSFYADLMISLLGRYSGCSIGDWSDVSNVDGTFRLNSQGKWYYDSVNMNAPMVHGVKI